ncbi:hypothetical protein [Methanobacterium congolense]|jgi:DNA-directed RNA polymerase subunit RPC12/RpoP|uniref:Uncharacterized protein n=1 Tax=Methanobacterium congolense TaxID=118062 RepID=A0A1D3L4E5_9EURY|nr:hypothetical protein [Methanobacterium congolense]SCG86494.1 putative protein [Methanobacterium congolense]
MTVKAWKLEKSAKCYNCGDATIHDITVDEYTMEIRCRDCGFARYYTFHMVNLPKK